MYTLWKDQLFGRALLGKYGKPGTESNSLAADTMFIGMVICDPQKDTLRGGYFTDVHVKSGYEPGLQEEERRYLDQHLHYVGGDTSGKISMD